MAVETSNERASQVAAATNFADRVDDSKLLSGPMQYAFVTVEWDGDESAAEVVDLIELPEGAMVFPEHSKVIVSTDCAATLTVDVGDATDPNRYADGVDAGAVGEDSFLAPAIPAAVATKYEVEKEDSSGNDTRLIQATWATLATPAAGVIHFLIAFKTL